MANLVIARLLIIHNDIHHSILILQADILQNAFPACIVIQSHCAAIEYLEHDSFHAAFVPALCSGQ
jgi:hypothetical protein